MTKRTTDSGLPRREPRDDTREGIAHIHAGEPDFHPRGNLPHDHGPAGNVIFKGSPQPPLNDRAVDQWMCPVIKHGLDGRYVCVRPDQHNAQYNDLDGGWHTWTLDPNDDTERLRRPEFEEARHPDPKGFLEDHLAVSGRHGEDITPDLAAAPPPGDDGEAADPPATPSAGDALEPSGPHDAGSGGGSGRPYRDASEAVLGAAMGVINPVQDAAGDLAFQIRHAEESARVLVLGQHAGNMFQAIADGQFVANKDLRGAYRKIRQMADFHGINLDDEGAGS